jgi:hypothetical protein
MVAGHIASSCAAVASLTSSSANRRRVSTKVGSAGASALRAWLGCQSVVAHNSSRILPVSTLVAHR